MDRGYRTCGGLSVYTHYSRLLTRLLEAHVLAHERRWASISNNITTTYPDRVSSGARGATVLGMLSNRVSAPLRLLLCHSSKLSNSILLPYAPLLVNQTSFMHFSDSAHSFPYLTATKGFTATQEQSNRSYLSDNIRQIIGFAVRATSLLDAVSASYQSRAHTSFQPCKELSHQHRRPSGGDRCKEASKHQVFWSPK